MLPQFSFNYILYQPNPSKDSIHYWVDGEPTRRFMKISDFLELVQARTSPASKAAYDSCQTYSFYLYDPHDCKVIHLNPQSQKDEPYKDNLNSVVHNKVPRIIKNNQTIEETLVGYGFNVPTNESMQNLKVTLSKQETDRQGFFSRMYDRIKAGRH